MKKIICLMMGVMICINLVSAYSINESLGFTDLGSYSDGNFTYINVSLENSFNFGFSDNTYNYSKNHELTFIDNESTLQSEIDESLLNIYTFEKKQFKRAKRVEYNLNLSVLDDYNIIIAEEFITNTTKDTETMTKISNFRDILKTKTFQQVTDYVLTPTGALSNNILFDSELSSYGSYRLDAISHFNRAMIVFLMKENLNQQEEIDELKSKETQRDACWDLPLNEVQGCMRTI